ncbi:MAG TPA: hypothetical protein VF183_09350, partial [Acidimicrobiales bacterium]
LIKMMLVSGAIGGIAGGIHALGTVGRFVSGFSPGYGFTGIAVALLGRNHPVGIGVGALLFGYLDRNSQILDLRGVPKEIIEIMQGVIILSAVVAYEVVDRIVRAQEARTAASAGPPPERGVGAPSPAGSPA